MTSPLPLHDPAAEERASYWAARLDGSTLSADDQQALEAWLSENPAHRTLLSHYCQFSADLEQLLPALAEAGTIETPQELAPLRQSPARKWITVAALAAAAGVAIALWTGRTRTQHDRIATAVAQRQTLTLADGTRAELNALTSVQIELGVSERRVRLASGEAFFTVTKDPSRPFIVETPAGSVHVTGTVFNVRAETSTELEVVVVQGSVQVRPGEAISGKPSEPVRLGAGEGVSANADGVVMRKLPADAMEDALAWRQGQIVFEGVPLQAALARFARYHGRGITVAPAVADLSVGVRYSLDDLDGFLRGMQDALHLRVTRDLHGTILVGAAEPAETGKNNRGLP